MAHENVKKINVKRICVEFGDMTCRIIEIPLKNTDSFRIIKRIFTGNRIIREGTRLDRDTIYCTLFPLELS